MTPTQKVSMTPRQEVFVKKAVQSYERLMVELYDDKIKELALELGITQKRARDFFDEYHGV